MARKMIVRQTDGAEIVMTQAPAANEAQLQSMLRDHPEILPIDDFGLTEPMLVVGKETALASGSVDLVGLARGGEPIVVEFKTGPQNADFRSALAQLVDYGSDLWGMDLDRFEHSVAARYFASKECADPRFKGLPTLREAAAMAWPDMSDTEWDATAQKLAQRLSAGALEYVLAAQQFTDPSERSIRYLNEVSSGPRFYAVEVVRFLGGQAEAFECRTVVRPQKAVGAGTRGQASRETLLGAVVDGSYRDVIDSLLDSAESLGLILEWGSVGVSMRAETSWRSEPVTIGWLFPPGRSGWSGLTDLTLGYDSTTVASLARGQGVFERYAAVVGRIACGEPLKAQTIEGRRFGPECVVERSDQITDALGAVVELLREARA